MTQQKRHSNTCYITMVAIDNKGKPANVEALDIRDDTEQRRFDEAKQRREARMTYYQNHYQNNH